jgi:hypothetical protein
LAVFQGRVWLANTRELVYSGTTGYSDFDAANAAGSTTLTDSDLVHSITCLRNLNNYLFIFGDNSIKQIGSVTVSNSITNFSIVTLSSDIGTTFPMTIQSYNRLVLFANTQGIYALLGASVEKISDPMDGIFQNIDFTQPPVAFVDDVLNLHTYQLLVKYNDPLGARSLIQVFQQKKWCVSSQGNSLIYAVSAPIGTQTHSIIPYGTSGSDVTALYTDTSTGRAVTVQTALSPDQNPFINKRAIRIGVAQFATVSGGTLNISLDSENSSNTVSETVGAQFVWFNVNNQQYQWKNSLNQNFAFSATGRFSYLYSSIEGSGLYLGASLTGTFNGYNLHAITIEYQTGALFASRNI